MRGIPVLAILLAAVAAHGGTAFVSPPAGAQVIGPQLLEVSTDTGGVDRVEFYVDGVLVGVARSAPYRIAHDFGTSLAPRKVQARVHSDRYRRTESVDLLTAAVAVGESLNVDVVEVPLRVRSRSMLRTADIRVRENQVEQTVRDVLPGRGPAHFFFVVDRSLSMGDGKLTAALEAVDAARARLRADDTASLVLFNHHVAQPVRLGKTDDAVSLSGTPTSGGTSMRDAIASTPAGSARTYVIVITDGGDRNSLLSEEQALRTISGTRTVVYGIVMGRSSHFLGNATRTTGGDMVFATTSTVRTQIERMLDDINSRYTLVYQSRGTSEGWRTIDVTSRNRGLVIESARKGYFTQ